ncbi:hypothetical protein ACSFE6_12110 [Pseudomonas baetica]|uniref:hypothetical protein n=1 Tax=Pseudomonas baetica TaxID=674054 RepID=UPI003EEBAA20
MARMMVGMGEIGVMHPQNRGIVTALWTVGASPCIILGVQKGSTALLAHIHRANNLYKVVEQVGKILADAVPKETTARAFIATEKYTDTDTNDAEVQSVMITVLEEQLHNLGIRLIEKSLSKSAACIAYEGYQLSDGSAFNLSPLERKALLDWTLAYDSRFQGLTGKLPMAIRVGINNETPEVAINRMYPK